MASPDFDWRELLKAMPIIAGSIDPRAGAIATLVEQVVDAEVDKVQEADPSLTREEARAKAIADAAERWEAGLDKAKQLRQMGHEGEG